MRNLELFIIRFLLRRLSRAYVLAASLLLTAVGASSCESDDVSKTIGQLTEKCTHDSDCDGELVCVFQRCTVQCKANKDCKRSGARCVQSQELGEFVCLFAEDAKCSFGKAASCESSLECTVDDQCRGPCERNVDCPKDQVCSNEGACAEEDAVTSDGSLISKLPSSVDAGRPADASVSLPREDDAGGAPPNDAGRGTGRTPEAADASTPQNLGTVGGPADSGAAAGFDFVEPKGGEELVDNNNLMNAQPLSSADIFLAQNDQDWFYVDVPDDGDSHIITVVEEPDFTLAATIRAYSGADNGLIGTSIGQLYGVGRTRTTYVTVGSGTRTLLEFSAGKSSANARTRIQVTSKPSGDSHEPNDTPETATAIAVGEAITARMINGYVTNDNKANVDRYVVDLQAGTATFEITSIPKNLRVVVDMAPAPGQPGTIVRVTSTTEGGGVIPAPKSVSIARAGQYVFSISDSYIDSFYTTPVDHLVASYSFIVKQVTTE